MDGINITTQSSLEPEPTDDEIRAAIAEEDSKRARVAEILLGEGEADAAAREKNGWQAPLHLCGMNGYAKVRKCDSSGWSNSAGATIYVKEIFVKSYC